MRRRRSIGTVAALVVAAVLTSGLPAAADPSYPSQQDVDRAKTAVTSTEGQADSLQQELDASYAEQRDLEITAEVAAEDYNAAQETLAQAQAAEQEAQEVVATAKQSAEAARLEFGKYAAATYRTGGDLAAVGAVLESSGPQDLVDTVATMERITDASGGAYLRYKSAKEAAEAAETQAQQALQDRQQAADEAQNARDAAAEAADEGQRAVAAVEAEQQRIIAALATARSTSVQLEQQRQDGLRAEAEAAAQAKAVAEALAKAEAEATAKAEAAAREKAAADARAVVAAEQAKVTADTQARADAQARAQSAAAAQQAADQRAAQAAQEAAEAAAQQAQSQSGGGTTSGPGSQPGGASQPTSPPLSGGGESTTAGAAAAIAFARAQLGKPYVWGAAGPSSFDCSGLTLRAWQAGGVNIPRVSRSQYAASQPIDFGDLRPGDLLFWSTGPSASSIYHVALYIGGGQMIHAPNSRRPVEQKGMFYMGTPDFYGRV